MKDWGIIEERDLIDLLLEASFILSYMNDFPDTLEAELDIYQKRYDSCIDKLRRTAESISYSLVSREGI